MTKLSKAAQKRLDQQKQSITNVLNARLIDFKNRYLQDYADYSVVRVVDQINYLKTSDMNRGETQTNRDNRIARVEEELKRDALIRFEAMTEANRSYNQRISGLVDKLISFGFSTRFMRIEKIRSDFSFLISNDEMEIHARVIYACGEVNAPHYRFVTTKRNK